jgi:hypothetical protein
VLPHHLYHVTISDFASQECGSHPIQQGVQTEIAHNGGDYGLRSEVSPRDQVFGCNRENIVSIEGRTGFVGEQNPVGVAIVS